MSTQAHPIPRSAHPGVEAAYQHLALPARGETRMVAGAAWFPDVSEFNGPIDWAALGAAYRAGTIAAVAIRASFGTVRADARFAENQRGARAQGIPAVYYHFAYPAYNTAAGEGAFFNSVVGPLQVTEAQAGDFEDDPAANGFPRGQVGIDWCRAFLTALAAPASATWWYTYPALLAAVGLQVLIGAWPFWEADYSATPDSAFAPAIARQFTDCGSTPGVGGCCDQSRVLRAPLSQWLTGGDEVLDPNDPIVQELRTGVAELRTNVAATYWEEVSGFDSDPNAGPPARHGMLSAFPGLVVAVADIQAKITGLTPTAIDVNALATALAAHPLTATLSDTERDAVATHVLQHLAKDAAAG